MKIDTRNLNKATGTISGVAFGAVVGVLIFGAGDYDNAPWQATSALLLIGGVAGYFYGRRNENRNFK